MVVLGAVRRPLGGTLQSTTAATSEATGRRVFDASGPHRTSRAPLLLSRASALPPSPHSASLEPPQQPRGRQQQEKGSRSSAAVGVATATATTTASPSNLRRRLSSSPPPPPRSPPPRLSSSPQHQQHLPAWLGSAVRRAVLSLDEAPLLVVKVGCGDDDNERRRSSSTSSSSSSFVTHALPRAALSAPALWPAIAATVVAPEGKEPEALLLVHKIEEEGERATAAASSTSSHHHLRLSDFAALERGGIATAELAGRVGDCCHGGEEGEGAAAAVEKETGRERGRGSDEAAFVDGDLRALVSPRSSSSPSLHSETHWGASSAADVAFYGVVVQTAKGQKQLQQQRASSPFSYSDFDSSASAASGCFVLKTVRTRPSSPGGCSCVYYSLTRVGRAGEPLAEQLQRSWLA